VLWKGKQLEIENTCISDDFSVLSEVLFGDEKT
jgi:hypothetical protein